MDSEHYYLYQIIIGTLSLLCAYLTLFLKFKGKFVIVSHKKNSDEKAIGNRSYQELKPFLNFGFFSIYKRSSLKDVKKNAKFIADKLEQEFYPSIIIGIGRGGAFFGSLISYYLGNAPFLFVDRLYNWDNNERDVNVLYDFTIPEKYLDRVLIVAGETHSGDTMIFFRKYLKDKLKVKDIRTCSFYKQGACNCTIDYVCVEGDGTSLMPWQDSNFIRDSLNSEEGKRLKIQHLLHEK